ncbi:MAG: C-type lectin domain-containing protein, partial [Planctomycetia bacterium]|nr:C-type lectin domain-containing protein [Planctomycetia bacterium]
LTATAGQDSSGLSIYLIGVLNTGNAGSINLSGPNKILLEGTISPLQQFGSTVSVDTGRVYISTQAALDIRGQVNAQSLVDADAAQINVFSTGFVHVIRSEGLIDLDATANILIATDGQVLSSGSIRLFGQNVRVDGSVDNGDGTAGPRVLVNAVESIVVTGGITSWGRLDLNAGVGADWSEAKLTGPIASRELSGGLVRVEGRGKVYGATLKVASGQDIELQANPELASAQRVVQTAQVRFVPQIIDVVVGYRQVAGGVVYTPVVTWELTKVEKQTGVELVVNGNYYYTMDVTLNQDGYYNGTRKREYFIQGIDYMNARIDWQGNAPAADATFNQLSDAQRNIVLATLGYKRLYDFAYANARQTKTQNGSTSVLPWTPSWSTAAKHIVQINLPGLENRYIRLPINAELDLARIVTQGSPTTGTEKVGTYTDKALTRYTQDRSRYQGFDDADQSGERFRVSYLGNGTRTFTLTDGFGGTVNSAPDWTTSVDTQTGIDLNRRQVLAPQGYLPNSLTVTPQTPFSIFGITIPFPVGIRKDVVVLNADMYPMLKDTSLNSKTILEYVPGYRTWYQALADAQLRGGSLAIIQSDREHYWAMQIAKNDAWLGIAPIPALYSIFGIDNNWRWVTGERVSYNRFNNFPPPVFYLSYAFGGLTYFLHRSTQSWMLATDVGTNFAFLLTSGFPTVPSGYLLERSAVEDFYDYNYNWTSKTKDVLDTRLTLNFQWVSNTHYLYTERPVYSLVDTQVPVTRQVASTVWVSQPITEQRTILKPVRELVNVPVSDYAVFTAESLKADSTMVLDAARDVSLSGLVTAKNAGGTQGSITIDAGRDFLMTGAKPEGASQDTLDAIAGINSVSNIAITSGGNFTLAESINIRADDGNSASSVANKLVVKAGDRAIIRGRLSTTNTKIGEVTVEAGDDIELKGEIVAGHVANIFAGTDG